MSFPMFLSSTDPFCRDEDMTRTILITGASPGIGRETARQIAARFIGDLKTRHGLAKS